jgi:hypothetical protein
MFDANDTPKYGNKSKSVKQTNPGINNQNWNKISLKNPDRSLKYFAE